MLEQSDLAEHHDIVTGIQHKTQIPFIGTLGLVGKKILGCKPDANGNQVINWVANVREPEGAKITIS